jgi:catechol 2,3-dioxygenase-like lactoylglutathione lyase family enzyme
MTLGAFSISLSVSHLEQSKSFYETLGFSVLGGSLEQKYLIMKNGNALLGLFEGMFDGWMLTFNPGWDEDAKELDPFDDVRKIGRHLVSNGIEIESEHLPNLSGPGHLVIRDPDGNAILIDQHR